MAITHVLLDIEGTTCPVSFVAQVLFPYASAQLRSYLQRHRDDPEVIELLVAVDEAWRNDDNADAQALWQKLRVQGDGPAEEAQTAYLQQLIQRDVKLTALKDLQGRIWKHGYASGDITAPLFEDVPAALQRWSEAGFVLGVYCQAGDLTSLFSYWFDTKTGMKQTPASYASIATQMNVKPSDVLFISDAIAELKAASEAGMTVLFSDREGNPERDAGCFERISDYRRLDPSDVIKRHVTQ
jgi:enolase-phosphatase E1